MFKSQTSKIIITIFFLLTISIVLLFVREDKQHNYTENKSWWSVSFIDPNPKSKNLNFQIENYTNSENFIYLLKDKSDKLIKKEKLTIPNNSREIIKITSDDVYFIEISHKNKKRLLYK